MERRAPLLQKEKLETGKAFSIGFRGVCKSSAGETRTGGSLAAPRSRHPGAPSTARALFWGVRLGNDFSLCLWRLEQVLSPSPGDSGAGDSHRLPDSAF